MLLLLAVAKVEVPTLAGTAPGFALFQTALFFSTGVAKMMSSLDSIRQQQSTHQVPRP